MSRVWGAISLAVVLLAATTPTALAHDAPEGSEWVMADWMVSTFFLFAAGAGLAFLAALKAGWLSNLEDAKYWVVEFEEPDYSLRREAADFVEEESRES